MSTPGAPTPPTPPTPPRRSVTNIIPFQPPPLKDCWKKIGVRGDGSCKELELYVHCRNCPVYVDAGRTLLERRVPEEYRKEWSDLLAKPKEVIDRDTTPLFVFRLQSEWLAMSTDIFVEVAEMRRWRKIPFRKDPICLGVINIRGELQVCVSMQHLLKIPADPKSRQDNPRILVIAKDAARWAFPVDEVYGLARIKPAEIMKAPVTLSKASAAHIKGSFQYDSRHAGILDEELVCYQLVRSVQ